MKMQQISEQNYRYEKFYHDFNGKLYEITRKVPLTANDHVSASAATAHDMQQFKQQQHELIDRKKPLIRQHSQPQPEKPQPPPRTSSRSKSSETEYMSAQMKVLDASNDPLFDRTQRQRHSSRSVGGFDRESEFGGNKNAIHQRHSSGPSELITQKGDSSDWILNLPHKGDKKQEIRISEALKNELLQILQQKRPLQRQDSGPSDYADLQNNMENIIEWIKSQHTGKNVQHSSTTKDEQIKNQQKTAKNEQYAVPRKRHSFGHTDNTKCVGNASSDWLNYPPAARLTDAERNKLDIAASSNVDISNNFKSIRNAEHRHERTRHNRKLRHSASEVVTPASDQMASKYTSKQREKYQYIFKAPSMSTDQNATIIDQQQQQQQQPHRSTNRERPRRNHTQRSATVSDMSHQHKQSSVERESSHSSSLTKCTDPMCNLLPICTNPNCRLNDCFNTRRCSSLTRCGEPKCTNDCFQTQSFPACMDPKCLCHRTNNPCNYKHNSLPKCVSTHRTEHESSSFPRTHRSRNGSNGGKLVKSASAASLNSRRRRHKTVHFGENLLREVCQNRKLIEPFQKTPSEKPSTMQDNIQLLYNFVEGVLSAWVDEDDEQIRSGAESEPERGRPLKPLYICDRIRLKTISRVVHEAAQLRGTLKLGNSRYRHRHWRGTAKICNERFLRKISDDDRMSLTTAVSDEDDGESVMASPYKAKATGTAAASFNCTGAVRKAGFLSVKKWLLRKKHQIELARKRGWKGYWVCLKGTTLLFYPCDSREGRTVDSAPKHLIIVDGAIMQPIPEHPKRDYIFCLSTAFGDAYLFQAPCQVELENWVNSIHNACAAAFARHRGKTGTLHLLQEEIYRLERAIESDHKLKNMAELQQSVVTDQDTRHQIQTQILQWEENLERLHCEQFRLRCYMASLQGGELPNPKSLLTHVSRPTKNTLNKLGVFTVSSFHAFICARSPSLLNNLLAGRGATKRRPPLLSRSNSGSSRRSMQMNSRDDPDKTYKVALPDNNYATVYLRDAMSVEEFLANACARKNLNPMEHFVRVKKRRDMEDHNYFVPHRNDLIETYLHTHEVVEVCAKILYQVELQRGKTEHMWGFSVEAELIENADRQDELCCYVSRVEDKSVAMQNGCSEVMNSSGIFNSDCQGIIKGDEIMVINGAIVSDLDMMYIESVLQEEFALCMMMRSSRTEPPDLVGIMRVTDDMIDSLVCPPPPSEPPAMSEEMINELIVPVPGWSKDVFSPEVESSPAPSSIEPQNIPGGVKQTSRTSSFEIENLLKTAEQVTGFCRSPQETRKSSPTGSVTSSVSNVMLTPSRQLTDAEKLRKVILELVDTERAYVKHLNNLLEHYLEPLKRETFLSNAEIAALFGNIQEIVTFQRQFLQNLEEALDLEPDFHKFDHSSQFKNVLFSIGSAFLYYVNHFKLYSSFCASHSKAQKVLHPNEGNQALQEFLIARNPKQQHSSTLESYLIKPIQRILKYPLLLQQLRNLTDPRCEEHTHLVEALKGMEKVAEHINEMQRIHEEYGAIFDHLFRQHQKSCKQPIDLSPGDLLYYGGVEWLNISDFLGKIKKGLELHAMCFVFKSAVVFLCKERLRQKKKLMGVSNKNATNEVEIIRYQVLIPVTEVQVRASSAKDMDSHFLWELIHLRSQLQRRSEKVYVLSNSTADFRNAFLKTIRQIIRESVRNMSIPMKGMGSLNSLTDVPPAVHRGSTGNSQTLERPKQQIPIMQGSQTLGKTKKNKNSQRHSAGNIDYDNIQGGPEGEDVPIQVHSGFRVRSKTVGDSADPTIRKYGEQEKDPGTKSEGEEDSQQGTVKKILGRTPNHLTLSTTSTLSVGSTGSQARLIQSSHAPATYQPVLMKDLGKLKSPSKETNVTKLFENDDKTVVGGGGDGGGGDGASGIDVVDAGDDEEEKFSEQVMDRHLSELVADKTGAIYDIAQYMANLKEKHMESELESNENRVKGCFVRGKSTETDVESDETGKSATDNVKASSEEEDISQVVIDKRVDKVFKSEKLIAKEAEPKRSLKSPRQSVHLIHSPDRSGGVSPIKIIKVKSPRGSMDKRMCVSLSRDNSRERPSSGRVRRASEGGILKTMYTNDTPSTGILKRSSSPKSKSPERQGILSRKSLSPGTSFDSRSPDRWLSPHSSFDNRSPDRRSSESCYADLDFRHSHKNGHIRSNQSSFESRSPECDRKRSLSAHSSFIHPRVQEQMQYQCYPMIYHQQTHSPERKGKRLLKSLERTPSKDMYYAYRSGLSPERIYRIGFPIRSQSAENGLIRNGVLLTRSNESLARSLEHPTCVECLYQQRKASQQQQQQKTRARQSRARKKVPRGSALNDQLKYQRSRSKSEESCVDCNDFYEIHV